MTACIRGCRTRPDTDGNRHPIQTEHPSCVCRRCEDRMLGWLETIPENYALLPAFLEPGSVGANPESKTTKNPNPPVPVRLEVLDLLDRRLGRRWQATEPADDRRGVLGTLETWARLVREEKNITASQECTVAYEVATLRRHLLWICEQRWVVELYDDLQLLHRQLSDAVGDYRPKPVGVCGVVTEDGECNGPLMPSRYGGVHCGRCGDVTPVDRLRFLGSLLQPRGAM